MALNPYFLQGSSSEQRLVQDLINEQLRMYGQDIVYLPRKIVNKKSIIKEIVASTFDDAYRMEAYLLNYQGFEGNGDVLSKFGVTTTDAVNLVVSKEKYEDFITPFLGSEVEVSTRPQEGDLVYLPLDNTMFEIKYVEARKPFYQLNNLYVYTLTCEVMDAELDQDINTSIEAVDTAADSFGFIVTLGMVGLAASTATATVQKATSVSGLTTGFSVGSIDLVNDGTGYTAAPEIGISTTGFVQGVNATAVAIMTSRDGQTGQSIDRILITNPGFGYTEAPTVTIRSVNVLGSGGIATAILANDGLSAVTVTDGGDEYGEIPNVIVGTSSPGATATALVGTATSTSSTVGFLTGFNVTNGGLGYKTAPTVTIAPPPVRVGVVTAWSPSGTTFQGLGFAVGDVCLIKPADGYTVGTGTDAYVKITAVDGQGRITASEIIYGGRDYDYGRTYQIDPPGGGTRSIEQLVSSNFLGGSDTTQDEGTQATATASITAGVVTSITITNAGIGYSTGPVVTISNLGTNKNPVGTHIDALAEAVLNTNNQVAAIRFTNTGAGYTVSPTITIDPPAAVGFATGNYQYKEMVRGVGSGTTAFVQEWDFDDRILKVTNPDGNFIVGEAIVGIGTTQNGSDAKYIVKTVSTQDDTDAFNENTPFETEADEILDFSEINPFGEF